MITYRALVDSLVMVDLLLIVGIASYLRGLVKGSKP
jgi:hypothetical protein